MDSHDHRSLPMATTPLGAGEVLDPVCGMTIQLESARGSGLTFTHAGVEYGFCGRGCRLDFEEQPDHYLDPGYVPSM